MIVFDFSKSLNLISHNICMVDKLLNFHTVFTKVENEIGFNIETTFFSLVLTINLFQIDVIAYI